VLFVKKDRASLHKGNLAEAKTLQKLEYGTKTLTYLGAEGGVAMFEFVDKKQDLR